MKHWGEKRQKKRKEKKRKERKKKIRCPSGVFTYYRGSHPEILE